MATHIPIASLGPDSITSTPVSSIRAVVTLVWPYSSTTRQCALLLAEEDFRLRQARGQVRVRFSGPAAAALAKSGLGIADTVELRLQGARWIDRDDSVRTPGKSVDGELVFSRYLDLTVFKDGISLDVRVDEPATQAEEQPTPLSSLHTPVKAKTGAPFEGLHYSSPVFSHASGSPSLDPLVDDDADDLDQDRTRKRIRTSFGLHKQWRLADRSPSPELSVSQDMSGSRAHETADALGIAVLPAKDLHDISADQLDAKSNELRLHSDSRSTLFTYRVVSDDDELENHGTTRDSITSTQEGVQQTPTVDLNTAHEPLDAFQSHHHRGEMQSLQSVPQDLPDTTQPILPINDTSPPTIGLDTSGLPVQGASLGTEAKPESMPHQIAVTALGTSNTMDRTMTSLFGLTNTSSAAQIVSVSHTTAHPLVSDFELAFQHVHDPFPELGHVQQPFSELKNTDEAFDDIREVEAQQLLPHEHLNSVQETDEDLYAISEAAMSPTRAEFEAAELSRAQGMQSVTTDDPHADLDSTQNTFDQWLPSDDTGAVDSSNSVRIMAASAAVKSHDADASSIDGSLLCPAMLSPSLQSVHQLASRSHSTGMEDEAEDNGAPNPADSAFDAEKVTENEVKAPVQEKVVPQQNRASTSGSSIRNFFREQRRLSDLRLAAKRSSAVSSASDDKSVQAASTTKRASHAAAKLEPPTRLSRRTDVDTTSDRTRHHDTAGKAPGSTPKAILTTKNVAPKSRPGRALSRPEPGLVTQQSGTRTEFAYYRSLSALPRYLNPKGYVAFGRDCVDTIAVVNSATKEPIRAKTGPLDYYTSFSVMDDSSTDSTSTSVDIFRPHRKSMPIAEAGDVVLLRAFAVKSRSRAPYLMSTDASAWCVWRFSQQKDDSHEPAEEQIRGPEVEFNDEERKRVFALLRWWKSQQSERPKQQSTDPASNAIVPPT